MSWCSAKVTFAISLAKVLRLRINQSISMFNSGGISKGRFLKEGTYLSRVPLQTAHRRDDLALKSALSVTTMRPTVSALRCFHTSSSGLRSGEYGGRKKTLAGRRAFRQRLWSFLLDEPDLDQQSGRSSAWPDQQSFEEFDKDIRVHAAFPDHEPHATLRSDRGDQAHAVTRTGGSTTGVSPFLPQVRPA